MAGTSSKKVFSNDRFSARFMSVLLGIYFLSIFLTLVYKIGGIQDSRLGPKVTR